MPWPPTTTPPAFDQLEPAPVTVTVPSPPGRLPIVPKELANVPPVWIVSIPVPFGPTDRFWANAPGSATVVEFGVTVLMFPSVVCLGKPPIQLPLKNQLEENRPVQSVWACVETVDAREKRDRRQTRGRDKFAAARASNAARRLSRLSRDVPRAPTFMRPPIHRQYCSACQYLLGS